MAPEQDKWLTMRTVSAGSGHGPILFGKSEAGEGQLRQPRDLLIDLKSVVSTPSFILGAGGGDSHVSLSLIRLRSNKKGTL